MVILEVVKPLNDKFATVFFSFIKGKVMQWGWTGFGSSSRKWRFCLDREKLLSKNTGDPTVGSVRDKKENCSTRRGLRMGTGFREFPQTPRGRGFSLLGFYSRFKYFTNV